MAKLTTDDVLKLASLAKIDLSKAEVDSLRTELSSILDYVELLKKANVANLKPTTQVTGLENVMRSDEIDPENPEPDELMKNVPYSANSFIIVRKML